MPWSNFKIQIIQAMKITFIVPMLQRKKFSGGIYCILRHANELQAKGHQVTVVAPPKSEIPEWIDLKVNLIIPGLYINKKIKPLHKNILASALHALGYISRGYNGGLHTVASTEEILKHNIPESDITIATLWETARLVAKHGSGRRAYFCQHYEPIFSNDPVVSAEIEATYSYGLNLIANSTWLKEKLEGDAPRRNFPNVYLVNNAIDTSVFKPEGRAIEKSSRKSFNIISYGGRDARWKGLEDMANAIAIARNAIPEVEIVWNVYGDALLPPDNKIAAYNSLGFLDPSDLSRAYSNNDILLSASWYESFPLFPIEAMACGLPVITTLPGVEDYAVHNENCLIVEPKNPESIASAIISLARDEGLRKRLGSRAAIDAKAFNWGGASHQMECVLKRICFDND